MKRKVTIPTVVLALAVLAAPAASPAVSSQPGASVAQGGQQNAELRGWALFGRAVENLREKYRDKRDNECQIRRADERHIASDIFEDMPLEELRRLARISLLAEDAARAGRLYIITPELSFVLGMGTWISTDAAGGRLTAGDTVDFQSVEQFGLFHDAIGRWEGRVTDARSMGGTLTYVSGGCCGNGQTTGEVHQSGQRTVTV